MKREAFEVNPVELENASPSKLLEVFFKVKQAGIPIDEFCAMVDSKRNQSDIEVSLSRDPTYPNLT